MTSIYDTVFIIFIICIISPSYKHFMRDISSSRILYSSRNTCLEDYGGALTAYSWQDLSFLLADKVAEKLAQPFLPSGSVITSEQSERSY